MNWNRSLGGPLKLAGILAGVSFLFLVCAGGAYLVQIPFQVLFGWPMYLIRVVPQLNPDPATAGTAAVCLAGVVRGGHAFLRWLYAATGPEGDPRRWPWRWTLRIVGLVVLMFVAGTATVGLVHQTGWLLRSPEPLTRGGIHGASNRAISQNNLKDIACSALNYEEANHALPRTRFDANGTALHSWQTDILPQLERADVHGLIDLTKPWTHPSNAKMMSQTQKSFLNPALPADPVNGYAVSHYAGNVHVVTTDRPKSLTRDFPQGTANTILAGEVATQIRAWGDPLNARDPRLGMNTRPDAFGAPGRKPAFGMLDGSVRTFDPGELADLVGKVPE